jgi:protein BCP1
VSHSVSGPQNSIPYYSCFAPQQSEVDAEDSDEDGDANDVFGVTSVLNITEKQNLECVQQLRNLLLELCSEHASDQANTVVRSLLSDDSRPVGLIINERIVNIPAQISVPLLESLRYYLLQFCFFTEFYTPPYSVFS